MKVKVLIKLLEKCNPDAEVTCAGDDVYVFKTKDGKYVNIDYDKNWNEGIEKLVTKLK